MGGRGGVADWLCLCTISAGEGLVMEESVVLSLLKRIEQGPSEHTHIHTHTHRERE